MGLVIKISTGPPMLMLLGVIRLTWFQYIFSHPHSINYQVTTLNF